MTISPAQFIHLRSYSPNLRVSALLDEDVPTISDGYGGWNEQDRARLRKMTIWEGPAALKLRLPIVFDGWSENRDISGDVRTLEKMATSEGREEPAKIRITGHIPHSDLLWVIQELEWGDTIRAIGGKWVRQHFVILFWEYVTADIPKISATQAVRDDILAKGVEDRTFYKSSKFGYSIDPGSVAGANTIYTAHEGDTMTTIAAQQLGDYNSWRQIADINGLRDPLKKFMGGEKLRLPSL